MTPIRACGLLLASVLLTSAQAPRQQYKSGTDLVTTEVIVRNARSVFVPDLTMSDFVVFEDGVRQTVSTFVKIIGGQAVTEIPPPKPTEGLILPPTKGPEPGRVFIIFIDDLHIEPLDSIKARRVLQQISDVVVHDGDLVAFVSTGYSSIQTSLSYDLGKGRFNQVIRRTMGAGFTAAEIIGANQTAEGPAGLRHQAHVAFKTAYDLLEQAARITNRRKAFLYLSSGYDFNPYTDDRFNAATDAYASGAGTYRNPFDSRGQQFSEAELTAELVELTQAARRANVTFYPIDPRGLVAGPSIGSNVSMQNFQNQVQTSTSSLKVLADQIGGPKTERKPGKEPPTLAAPIAPTRRELGRHTLRNRHRARILAVARRILAANRVELALVAIWEQLVHRNRSANANHQQRSRRRNRRQPPLPHPPPRHPRRFLNLPI